MPNTFYLNAKIRRAGKVLLSLGVLLVCCSGEIKAQRSHGGQQYGGGSGGSGYSVSVNADYDVPVGNFVYTFKAAPAYRLNISHTIGNITINIGAGYHAYQPKQNPFYYDDGAGSFGTVSYNNFTVRAVYLSAAYNFNINDNFKIYGGVNFGEYFTRYAYHSVDQFSDDTVDLNEKDFYFAPKAGFTFLLNENIGVGLEAKYNFFGPTGNKSDNARVGTLYNSYAAGIVLTYNF